MVHSVPETWQFLRGRKQTPATLGLNPPATHSLQATVRIAFRRTPDQCRPGVPRCRDVKAFSAYERNDMGWLQQARAAVLSVGIFDRIAVLVFR